MTDLIIEGTKTKPYINFNSSNGELEIGGESYPENAIEFYKQIQDWLRTYLSENLDKDVVFTFKLVYFNTSSSKAILDIFEILEKHHGNGGKLKVVWLYEEDDEDIEESGQEFAEGLSLSFELKSY